LSSIFFFFRAVNSFRFFTNGGKLERGVWKGNFYTLLVEAQKIAFTPENIRSGFWNTGLVPLGFEIIPRALNIPAPNPIGPSISADSTALAP
jgi:hypothetical protein